MANLFTSQTPSSTDENSGAPLTVATTVYFTAAGTVTGGRFFAPLTPGAGTFTLKLWSVDTADPGTGTLLASKTLGTPTAGVWNSAVFDTPVTITPSTVTYRIGVGMSVGRYTVTNGFFGVSLTNGSIVSPENGGSPTGISVRNGTYAESETDFPVEQFNSSCYFVDVDFTASGGAITPDGIAVPVALGAPTVAFATPAAQPTGIEVPIALGAPAVYHYVAPTGIEVPITLGAPTIEAPVGPSLDVGSWAGLLTAVQSARADAELNRERERHPVECPYDGWPLTPTDRGLHCEFGGHVITPRA